MFGLLNIIAFRGWWFGKNLDIWRLGKSECWENVWLLLSIFSFLIEYEVLVCYTNSVENWLRTFSVLDKIFWGAFLQSFEYKNHLKLVLLLCISYETFMEDFVRWDYYSNQPMFVPANRQLFKKLLEKDKWLIPSNSSCVQNFLLFIYFNHFPNKLWFLRLCSSSLLKTLWKKEKLLVTSNFSFSHSVFYPFGWTFCHFHPIWYCRLQTLSVWKSLKFVVWERVKEIFI